MISDHQDNDKENTSPKVLSAVPNYLQPISTPSGANKKFKSATNPFELGLIERMKQPSFLSPNVFDKVANKSDSEEFHWTIDDLSKIAPVPIDEEVAHSQCTDQLDPEKESHIQEVIDTYFTQHHIIPSPWGKKTPKCCTAASSTPEHKQKGNSSVSKCNVNTQTMLSLPPKLPDHIEELLKPYFSIEKDHSVEDSDSLNLSNSRRKLRFSTDHEEETEQIPSSPICSGLFTSPTMSFLPTTPILKSKALFSPSSDLESPSVNDISPIVKVYNRTSAKLQRFSSSSSSGAYSFRTTSMNISESVIQEDISMIDTTQRIDRSKTDNFQDTGYSTYDMSSTSHFKNSTSS